MTDDRGRMPAESGSYSEVRERLLAMGYLSRPLDRYVLGGVARPGSFLRRHAAVSLRVAIATGPLLGLVFALAVVVANRPRFSHARDFLVLAGAFTIVFTATVFALELLAGCVLAALVRWRGRGVAAFPAVAARAGFAVSLALSAYLAYWWRRRSGGDPGIAIDLAGLAVLVLVNAALLRVSSLASLAALVRVSDLPVAPRESADRAASPARLVTPAAVAALLITAGFFVAPRSRAIEAPSPYVRTPEKGRLVVVAWDGVPSMVAREYVTASEFVAPSGSFSRGASLIPLGKPGKGMETSPASLWTGVATGRRENGIGGLEDERPVGLSSPVGGNVPLGDVLRALLPGRKVAVNAGVRTARTLWEILHDREGVGCIGWWATWPALAREGGAGPFDVVTDRALLALRRPSQGDFLIAPSELERRLNADFEKDLAELRHGFPKIPTGTSMLGEENGSDLEQAGLIDGYAISTTLKVLADRRVRDLFVHLPGLDIARMAVARRTPYLADRFVWTFAAYSWYQVWRLERSLAPEDTLVVIATPGRRDPLLARPALLSSWVPPSAPYGALKMEDGGEGRAPSLPTGPEPWGWIVLRGPDPSRGTRILVSSQSEFSVLDVAPTVLNLRGFPVSREMEGTSRAVYTDEKLRPAPIDTYGRNTLPAIPFSSSDAAREQETLERLRSLGYLN